MRKADIEIEELKDAEPLGIFASLKDRPYPFFLDSASAMTGWADSPSWDATRFLYLEVNETA